MKNKDFIHLHIHSEYSIGYSICKINEIYEKVKENNMSSFAITDYNNLLGLTDILVHPMVNEIQPIIGCEIEIDSQYKLVLLVMNEKGYKNLVNLVIMECAIKGQGSGYKMQGKKSREEDSFESVKKNVIL